MPGRRMMLVVGLGLAIVGAAILVAFEHDLEAAEARVEGRSRVIATVDGPLEFADAGEGAPLIALHGTGGGFDQGLVMTSGMAAQRIRAIAPSRFGYLRSSYPGDPSPARQADRLMDLLDHLGIRRAVIAGGSAGAVPAIHFAVRHPDRCAGLILLVPAANLQGRDPVRLSSIQEAAVRKVLRSDFLFWLGVNLAPERMIGTLLATNPVLLERASVPERSRATAMLRDVMPIGRRWRGMLNDARYAGEPARVDLRRVKVPALIISAEDDRFGTANTARFVASQVTGAELVIFPEGGHILVGHQDEVTARMTTFIKRYGAVAERDGEEDLR